MNKLVQITIDKELRSNPKQLAEMIVQISTEINECRNDLSELKERVFWKRTFSNNTRDLADAMIKQNDTISTFINIVQVLIGFNLHNAVVLGGLHQELSKVSGNASVTENEYFNLAKDYISETLTAAQNTNTQFDKFNNSLSSIKQELKEKEDIDREQTEILNRLKQKYEDKDLLDKQQSEDIEHLKKTNVAKESLDNEQSSKIMKLQTEISLLHQVIEEHTKIKINEIDNKLSNFAGSLNDNQTKQSDLGNFITKLNSKYSKLQLMFFIYVGLSAIVMIILFLK